MVEVSLRGTEESETWRSDPALYAPPKYRRACHYRSFTPWPIAEYEAPLQPSTAAALQEASAALQVLNLTPNPELRPLQRLLLRSESMASSRIEGLNLNAIDLARAEAQAETGRRIGTRTTEVLANIDAMEAAVLAAVQAPAITVQTIQRIHAALMAGSPTPGIAGQLRTTQNWIGGNAYNPCGATFVPPPAHAVPRLLDDLCQAIEQDLLPPVMQAALVHAQFETIHPFADGNGRTGRALIHVVLARRGLTPNFVPPVSVVLAADRGAYLAGLEAFRTVTGLDSWLELFATALTRSADLALQYLSGVLKLQQEWRERVHVLGGVRADSSVWALIDDVLPGFPVITVALGVAASGRTKAAVNQAFTVLEAAGVIDRVGSSARNRTWENAALLELIAATDGTA